MIEGIGQILFAFVLSVKINLHVSKEYMEPHILKTETNQKSVKINFNLIYKYNLSRFNAGLNLFSTGLNNKYHGNTKKSHLLENAQSGF